MTTLEAQLTTAIDAVTSISMDVAAYEQTPNDSFIELSRLCGQLQRLVGVRAAFIAGEVARRSAPELGQNGLAQSTGYRTPEELVRATTGSTAQESARAVRVGRLTRGDNERPWLAPVGAAVAADELSTASADSISTGLGRPSLAVPADELAAAARQLCDEAQHLDADRLLKRARQLRDELDAGGIAERESARHDERSLRFFRLPSGMSRLVWNMDQETAASVGDVFDRATSPKNGGPRFRPGRDADLADRILDDSRTREQLSSDVFAQLLRQGVDADSSQLLSTGAPSIRVLVHKTALNSGHGCGRIEGQDDPISLASVERLACGGSVVEIGVDENQPLNAGREQRLFTRRQRIALAARDGGCRAANCDRPPSWCEAHHIKHWQHGGKTDIADGILLCKHHHLLFHNNGWSIYRDKNEDYWLVPPPDIDPTQTPKAMPSKSRAFEELRRERASA